MSEQAIRGALQTHLLTLGWADQTSFEGKTFTPTPGVAYQEVATVFASAIDFSLSDSAMERGTFQVRMLYPLNDVAQGGIGVPTARAEAIKAAFPRNLRLPVGGPYVVKVASTPTISRGPPQGDRDVTVIRFRFSDR